MTSILSITISPRHRPQFTSFTFSIVTTSTVFRLVYIGLSTPYNKQFGIVRQATPLLEKFFASTSQIDLVDTLGGGVMLHVDGCIRHSTHVNFQSCKVIDISDTGSKIVRIYFVFSSFNFFL